MHFELVLGLGADLLPVVSRPGAIVAPGSKLRSLGKVPSRYTRYRQVVGIPGWTAYQAGDADLARWAREPDYGICVQTRRVRALDVDVPDRERVQAIVACVYEHVGIALPVRCRADSGKVLLAFEAAGDLAKRTLRVNGGIVELLATGQQFVAIGTHPSGARYQWVGGLPVEIPALGLDQVDALWSALVERFAVEVPRSGGAVAVRQRGETLDLSDPVADMLHERGLVLGSNRDGELLIACPWEAEHSTGEAGDGSTVWFPAGTNGHTRGHFKCLHGHCEGRRDGDFFAAVGYVEDVAAEFDVLPSEVPTEGTQRPLPAFSRDKAGMILATVENVILALRRPDLCGVDIRRDTFRDEIMLATSSADWRPFRDDDYTRLRIYLARSGFREVGRELIRDVVHMRAAESPMDSAIVWLERLVWDGVPRVDTFLERYFGAADTPYVQAVSRYMWSAMAGRVLSPGIKADMAPILIGEQGAAKSSSVAAMVPSPELFCEMSFGEKDDDLARKLRGCLVVEISELRGLRTREIESIKAFVSRTQERWVPKYQEFATTFARRCVFVGTTNQEEFLADETGNRRWLPVRVTRADIAAVTRDRLLLWAEAREVFRAGGIAYREAETLALVVHKEHIVTEPWVEAIALWLDTPNGLTEDRPATRKFLRAGEVAREALRIETKNLQKRDEMRIGSALRELGYFRKRQRIDETIAWVWVRDR